MAGEAQLAGDAIHDRRLRFLAVGVHVERPGIAHEVLDGRGDLTAAGRGREHRLAAQDPPDQRGDLEVALHEQVGQLLHDGTGRLVVDEADEEISGDVAGGLRLLERQVDDGLRAVVVRVRPPGEDGLGRLVVVQQVVDRAGQFARLVEQGDAREGPGALADVLLVVEHVAAEGE